MNRSERSDLSRFTAPTVISGVTERVGSLKEFAELLQGERGNETYGRYLNPTLTETEKVFERFLSAERVLLFASGMAAISSTIAGLARPGTKFIYSHGCYRKTDQLFLSLRSHYDFPVTGLRPEDFENQDWRHLVHGSEHVVVFLETPSNPLLKLIDVEKLCSKLDTLGVRDRVSVIVDSTMATPSLFHPREAGSDIEIHSATKYLAGHDSLFAGIVAGPLGLMERIHEARSILGGIINPSDLALLQQQMQTFGIRMSELSRRGLEVARFLTVHPKVKTVHYPGLPESKDYRIASKWVRQAGIRINPDGTIPFGSVISFEMSDPSKIDMFANTVGHLGVNFGGTHTILDPFGYRISPEFRQQLGISQNLFRLSVGLDYPLDTIISLLNDGLENVV